MQIKKHSSKNEYIQAGGLWVRNFTKSRVPYIDLNMMFKKTDFKTIMENENKNSKYPRVSDEKIRFKKIVIISDGYDFDSKQNLIQKFPKDVAILAVNGALKHWKLMSTKYEDRRPINGYIVNNPYPDCKKFLPIKEMQYYPTCIASERTSYEFLKKYPGDKYTFEPSYNRSFGKDKNEVYKVDDYRNPVCAAINLAYHFGVRKLMLFCCDDSFSDQRDYAVQLKNGLWTYPQHIRSQEVIDANLYWLTHQEEINVEVCDFSSGAEYNNANYINEDGVIDFFNEEEQVES